MLFVCSPKILHKQCFLLGPFSLPRGTGDFAYATFWGRGTNKEHYGMLWYFLEWSIWETD